MAPLQILTPICPARQPRTEPAVAKAHIFPEGTPQDLHPKEQLFVVHLRTQREAKKLGRRFTNTEIEDKTDRLLTSQVMPKGEVAKVDEQLVLRKRRCSNPREGKEATKEGKGRKYPINLTALTTELGWP
ncbi:hypothetical protein VNI00_018886 [Paramarasmius palmivorus]|uniref:Uncharacterized protein n=1 Tax=Paramarasmius palmivorus TaxID=297713 RepID=A0AAW0ASW6_9AGAR